MPGPPYYSHLSGEHWIHALAGDPADHQGGMHLGHSSYAAVLISILLGTVLLLLL